jgi:hypothetical protein
MIRERVEIGEEPTPVVTVPWTRTCVLPVNTGGVTVVVDDREDVSADGENAGLAVAVGQAVTFPCEEGRHLPLWAVTANGEGAGELTYLLPG